MQVSRCLISKTSQYQDIADVRIKNNTILEAIIEGIRNCALINKKTREFIIHVRNNGKYKIDLQSFQKWDNNLYYLTLYQIALGTCDTVLNKRKVIIVFEQCE